MATETLRPNAAGDECNIDGQLGCDSCASDGHYACVDEVTADDFTTYVKTNSATYLRDLYNLPASSGSGTISKITVYFRCYGKVTGMNFKASIKSDTTVTDGSEKTLATDYTFETFSQEWSTNPADSAAWEWTDIDALQIGVSIHGDGSSYAVCTQVYVVVDYTRGANAAVSIGVVATASRAVTFNRTASVIVGVLVSATRIVAWAQRAASVIIGVVASATRTAGFTRAASTAIGIVVSASVKAAFHHLSLIYHKVALTLKKHTKALTLRRHTGGLTLKEED